jgi:hypothetical protein
MVVDKIESKRKRLAVDYRIGGRLSYRRSTIVSAVDYRLPWCALGAPLVRPWCALGAPLVRPWCALGAPLVRPWPIILFYLVIRFYVYF